jgi:PTS system glucitol/sorbitol-specific IIB component
MNTINAFLNRIGRTVGGVVGALYQSGREAIDMVIRNVLPFMAFISLIIGFILATGIGKFIADRLTPLASSLAGLLLMSIICSLPVLSPLLGPGAVIAQIVGTLIGVQIGEGKIPPCSRSTPRSAVTSSRSGWPSARPSRRLLRSGCRRCCSPGWSPGRPRW